MSFDEAWPAAFQRLRTNSVREDEREELTEWKDALSWARGHFAECFAADDRDFLQGQPIAGGAPALAEDSVEPPSAEPIAA